MTRRSSRGMKGDVCGAVCGAVVAATMRGATHTPSFAMVETMAASCSGETPISWPIEIAPIETFDQRFSGLRHAASLAGQARCRSAARIRRRECICRNARRRGAARS